MATVTVEPLRASDEGVDQTVAKMRRMVADGRGNLSLRQVALTAIRNAGVAPKDFPGEVRAIFQFVRDKIRYLKDPVDVELVHAPQYTLQLKAGDCDDKAVLLATLLETIGHRTRFNVLAIRPGQFHHVIVEVKLGPQWVPLDATMEKAVPGWRAPGILRSRSYRPNSHALSGYDYQLVDRAAQLTDELIVEGAARGQLWNDLLAGKISHVDLNLSEDILKRSARLSVPAWQRGMMLKLINEARGVLRQNPEWDASRANLGSVESDYLGGFFGSVWNGIKSVAKGAADVVKGAAKIATSVPRAAVKLVTKGPGEAWDAMKSGLVEAGRVAQVIGPALVLVPGVGTVAAAAITTAGQIIAPGKPIPPDSIMVSDLAVGTDVALVPVGETAGLVQSAAATSKALEPIVQQTEPVAQVFTIPKDVGGIPLPIVIGAGVLTLILVMR